MQGSVGGMRESGNRTDKGRWEGEQEYGRVAGAGKKGRSGQGRRHRAENEQKGTKKGANK